MGKRAKNKEIIENKIIEAAKVLFSQKTFEEVTMKEIARVADVGLGTAYNYYASKEELYLIAGGTKMIFDVKTSLSMPIDTIDTLVHAIMIEVNKLLEVEKSQWRVSISSLTKASEEKPELLTNLVEIDYLFIEKIRQAFEELVAMKKYSEVIDLNILMDNIYSVLFSSVLFHFYNESVSKEQVSQSINEKIHQLIAVGVIEEGDYHE